MYEANPIAFLAEQAGGVATDGHRRILEIEPQSLHQRTPLAHRQPPGNGSLGRDAQKARLALSALAALVDGFCRFDQLFEPTSRSRAAFHPAGQTDKIRPALRIDSGCPSVPARSTRLAPLHRLFAMAPGQLIKRALKSAVVNLFVRMRFLYSPRKHSWRKYHDDSSGIRESPP